jgi:hypothetical protein
MELAYRQTQLTKTSDHNRPLHLILNTIKYSVDSSVTLGMYPCNKNFSFINSFKFLIKCFQRSFQTFL